MRRTVWRFHLASRDPLDARISLSELKQTALTRVAADLSSVLDCRDLTIVGLTFQDLMEDSDYSAAQALAAAAIDQGYDGVIVPTATRFTGWNLALFPERLRPTSTLAVLGTETPHLYLGGGTGEQ